MLVFNRNTREDFEDDLQKKIDRNIRPVDNVTVRTLNGFGFDLLRGAGKFQLPLNGQESRMHRFAMVMAEKSKKTAKEANSLVRVAELLQSAVVPASGIETLTWKQVQELAGRFGMAASEWVCQNVQDLLRRRIQQIEWTKEIDMSDQIWLPVKDGIKCTESYDWVFVDECQDLSKLQIALVEKVLLSGASPLCCYPPFSCHAGCLWNYSCPCSWR